MSEPTAVEPPRDTSTDSVLPTAERPVAREHHDATVESRESTNRDREPADSTIDVGPQATKTHLGLTFNDQRFLGILIAVMLALMGWHWAQLSGWGTTPVKVDRLPSATVDERIDINTATWVEFTQLESIGETLAERIVAYREHNGRFESIDDLLLVKGIGKKTLAKIRRYLLVKPE